MHTCTGPSRRQAAPRHHRRAAPPGRRPGGGGHQRSAAQAEEGALLRHGPKVVTMFQVVTPARAATAQPVCILPICACFKIHTLPARFRLSKLGRLSCVALGRWRQVHRCRCGLSGNVCFLHATSPSPVRHAHPHVRLPYCCIAGCARDDGGRPVAHAHRHRHQGGVQGSPDTFVHVHSQCSLSAELGKDMA